MDDRRFDSLTKALASGKSRRSVLKGLFGLGAAATVGSTLMEPGSEAARRPTPTPTPIRCPGNQTPVNGVCTCPASAPNKCGPDCCTSVPGGPPVPTHSECCDNACCFGTCYGEELCCATNNRGSGEFPLPPTNKICDTVNGPECCILDDDCCIIDGCCATVCFGGSVGADNCCSPEDFCPGGSESEDICCIGNTTCCDGNTNANACVDLSLEGACCNESDCEDPCKICSAEHICVDRCNVETHVCCTEQAGPGVCVLGDCCLGAPCTISSDDTGICCQTPSGTVCFDGETCPTQCSEINPCTGCATCVRGLCLEGCADGEICCDEECLSTSDFFACPADEATCCSVADACCNVDGCCSGACYGGDSGRDLCCDPQANIYCPVPGAQAQCCADQVNEKCCGTRGCCGNSQCNEEADVCCPSDSFACGAEEGNQCCGTATEKCCEGVCIPASECCPANGDICPTCEPNCFCGDGVVDPATNGLDCNGGIAAGGGICACGWCVVPLDGCPCGCAGNPECVRCAGDDICETYNQGGSCNGGAGVCEGEFCVDAPPSCADTGEFCEFSTDCCEGVCLNDECTLEAPLCAPTGQSCVTLACCEGVCSNNICTLFVPLCAVRGNSCASLECCNDDLCCTLAGDPGLTCHEPSECPPV